LAGFFKRVPVESDPNSIKADSRLRVEAFEDLGVYAKLVWYAPHTRFRCASRFYRVRPEGRVASGSRRVSWRPGANRPWGLRGLCPMRHKVVVNITLHMDQTAIPMNMTQVKAGAGFSFLAMYFRQSSPSGRSRSYANIVSQSYSHFVLSS
jgi:hypothetical protein